MSDRSGAFRLRRTWPQRLLICFNTLAIVAAVAAAGLIAYGKKTVGEVHRTAIHSPVFVPAKELPPGQPVNFLVVGTDSAEGLAPDDPLRKGREDVAGQRSDVIMIVRIDPKEQQARILSLPRDLWVSIPGHNNGKINSAMGFGDGGPSLLIDTIKANFGIDINHYVELNFAAFKNVVTQIGGVKVYLTHPLRDGNSGLFQPNTGCQPLDAGQALAYARARHLEWQDDNGKWHRDGTSDLGRIKRQKDFIRRVLQQAISKGARNPATLNRLITSVNKSVTLDPYTTAQDLIDLGRAFRSFEPDELETDDVPVNDIRRGGADVLELVQPAADEILARFRGTGDAGVAGRIDVGSVTVRVLNGTTVQDQGATVTDQLANVGFQVLSARDTEPSLRTEVRFRPTDLAEARLVARYLDADPVLVEDRDAQEITVVTGPDLKGVLAAPRPVDAIEKDTVVATSTTVVPPTTTTPSVTTTTRPSASDTPSAGQSYVPGEVPPGVSC